MTSYTLAELERLAAVGQGREHDSSRDHTGYDSSRYAPPSERTIGQRIYDFLYLNPGWHSRADIAKALNLKKTNWLNESIERLVQSGHVVKEKTTRPNGAIMFWYAVAR